MHKWEIIKVIKAQMVKERLERVAEKNRIKLYLIQIKLRQFIKVIWRAHWWHSILIRF